MALPLNIIPNCHMFYTIRVRYALPLLLLWLFLIILALSAPPETSAQEPNLVVGSSPAPLNGAQEVVFISQAVDASLYRTEDGLYWVRGAGIVRLHNTNEFNRANLKFGWPGWLGGNLRFNRTELLDFSPTKGGQPLPIREETITTTWFGQQRDVSWVVTQTSIEPDTRERIFFNWSQPIGSDILLTYSFGLLPAGSWLGTVGSTRITLKLPNFANEEMIVQATPNNYTFTGHQFEWILVDQEPTVNPSVTFIAPHFWQEIEEMRSRRNDSPLSANLRLAELYEQLVTVGVSHYSAQIEGSLQAAHQAVPNNPEPLVRLARLYRAQAAAQPDNLALLEEAVRSIEAALAAGATDDSLRSTLINDLLTLANLWTERDAHTALNFLGRAEAVGGDVTAITEQRRNLAESLVLAELERGDFYTAQTVAAQYGLPTDLAPYPWLTSSAVRIENKAGERTITFFATGDEVMLARRFGELASLLDSSGYSSVWDANTNTLTIRIVGDDEVWLGAGQSLASILDNDPEWDLLREVLMPEILLYRITEDTFEQYYGYREQVELNSRAGMIAEQLRQDASSRESAWEQAILNETAEHWQSLADSQSVHIMTRVSYEGTFRWSRQREWNLTLPANEVLEWQGKVPRHDRWLMAAGGTALGLFFLLAFIWLPRFSVSSKRGLGNIIN